MTPTEEATSDSLLGVRACRVGIVAVLGVVAFTWTLVGPLGSKRALAQTEPQPASHSTKIDTTADRYFFEAKAKAAQKQWLEALVLLEKAWEIKPSHDIAGNLGQVALMLGRYKKATTFLERCLRLFPPTGNSEQRAQIQALFESARAHVAQLQIRVKPQPGELVIDRATLIGPVATPAEPVFVDPGTHILQIRRNGQIIAETSVLAVANASHEVTLDADTSRAREIEATTSVRPKPAEGQEKPENNEPHHGFLHGRSVWPAAVLATVSVASFVSAGGLFMAAGNQASNADQLRQNIITSNRGLCPGADPEQCKLLVTYNERADSRYNFGYAMLGVGGASLIAAAAYVFWPGPNAKSHAGSLSSPRPAVGFDAQPGAGRLSCSFQF